MVSIAHRHDVAPFSGPPPIVKVLDETEQISETIVKQIGVIQEANETLNISELVAEITGPVKVLDETENISEAVKLRS